MIWIKCQLLLGNNFKRCFSTVFFKSDKLMNEIKRMWKCSVHSKWESVYLKSYYKILSNFLIKKKKNPDPTTGLLPSQHLQSKINLKYLKDIHLTEGITINKKRGPESNQILKETPEGFSHMLRVASSQTESGPWREPHVRNCRATLTSRMLSFKLLRWECSGTYITQKLSVCQHVLLFILRNNISNECFM